MRARLSAISNFTTSKLLTILQNWMTNTSEIILDGQVLTVTSVYFLSNDSSSVLASTSPTQISSISARANQSSSNETKTKRNVVLFISVGSAGGLLLFLCVCFIIILVCIFMNFKSMRHGHFKARLVVYIIVTNNEVITIIQRT